MFSKYNPPIRTFPHIPAATRLRGAEQEPNCEIENPESQSKVRDIRYDLLFLVIFLPRSRHNLPEYIGAPYTVYRASKPHSVRVTNSAISGLGSGKPRVGRPCRRRSAKSLKTPYRRRRASTSPSPRMPQGHLPLHPRRQGVLGPEPHALMRGISSPLREGGL